METIPTTDAEFLSKLQEPSTISDSLAFHALQPGLSIRKLSHGSLIAATEDFVIGSPLAESDSLPRDLSELVESQPNLSFAHIQRSVSVSLRELGFSILQLGSEAKIPLPFDLTGKGKSDLRRALNRSKRAGIYVREISESEFSSMANLIDRENRKWFAGRKTFKREFRFLARPFRREYKPGERRFVAFRDDSPVGISVYDPVYESGRITGYLEAIIRAFDLNIPGLRDHLTLKALETFSCEDKTFVSLGLCPFHTETVSEKLTNAPVSSFCLKQFYRFGGELFNCAGLAFHKRRYRPTLTPIYFATRGDFPVLELLKVCRASNIDPLIGLAGRANIFCGALQRSRPAPLIISAD